MPPSDPVRTRPPLAASIEDEPLVRLGLALGVVVGLTGLACWLGAQLAAVLFSRRAMPVGIDEGVTALVELPHHLSYPGDAWPSEARAALPGPIAYWSCTAVVTAVVIGATASCTLWWHRRCRTANSGALGVRAHAGFARPTDLRRLAVKGPQPGRLTLGYAHRRLLAAEPRVSLAVVGPTGCGKTAGFAIPALLEWGGPIIATSVKSDLLDATIELRRRHGRVWVYDPTSSSRYSAHMWSPLAACRTWAGAMRTSSWLCDAAQPRADTTNDYWYTHARKALAPYLFAAAVTNRSMRDVVRWIDAEESGEVETILRRRAGVDDAIDRMLAGGEVRRRREELRDKVTEQQTALMRNRLASTAQPTLGWASQSLAFWPFEKQTELDRCVDQALDSAVIGELQEEAVTERRRTGELDALITAQSLWCKEPRLRGSVFATIENVLIGYADPGVGAATERCEIDLEDWLAGDNTIYVVAPSHEQSRLRPVLSVLVQQAIRAAYDHANIHGGALPSPCLVLLDEAGNIAPLPDLPSYASTGRSHGITLVSIWQDLAQMKAVYGASASTVLNNHGAKLFGTGIADEATLEYVSRLIGDERRTEANVSRDVRGGRRSVSEHTTYRRTAPAEVLRRMRTNEAVLLYGNALPVHVRLRPWFSQHARGPSRRAASDTF
jgi:type IV secretion system protein VirD4